MGKNDPHNDTKYFRLLLERPDEALVAIYTLHGARLENYVATFINNDREFINEVMTETFIVVWQKREEVAALDKPYFWMQSVARQQGLYILRKERKHNNIPLEDDHLAIIGGEQADRQFKAEEIERQIREILGTLPRRQREVFMASKFEHLTIQEMMQKFSLSEQTIKNTLSIALKKIRSMLKKVLTLFF